MFPQHFLLLATKPCLCPLHFQLAVPKAMVYFALIESWRAVHLKGRPCRPGCNSPAISTGAALLHTLLHYDPACSSKTIASLLLLLWKLLSPINLHELKKNEPELHSTCPSVDARNLREFLCSFHLILY